MALLHEAENDHSHKDEKKVHGAEAGADPDFERGVKI